jgi:hypothetical protein
MVLVLALLSVLCLVDGRSFRSDIVKCWLGPHCEDTVMGLDFSTPEARKRNNCWRTQMECQEHNSCFQNKGGRCVLIQLPPGDYLPGHCYATKKQCDDSIPKNFCYFNVAGKCIPTFLSPGDYGPILGLCYRKKIQCSASSPPKSQEMCFFNVHNTCLHLPRFFGEQLGLGSIMGQCYMTKDNCQNKTPPLQPPSLSPTKEHVTVSLE